MNSLIIETATDIGGVKLEPDVEQELINTPLPCNVHSLSFFEKIFNHFSNSKFCSEYIQSELYDAKKLDFLRALISESSELYCKRDGGICLYL